MTTTTESPKYPVAIPAHRLRQPLDITGIQNFDPHATCNVRAWLTETAFAELCDGNIRNFLSLRTEGPDGWDIFVGPEEALVGDNARSPQERCIVGWLNTHRPGWEAAGIVPEQLARYGEDVTLPVLHFLMNFYDLLTDPWEHEDDQFFLQQMAEHNIGYEDIAILPHAMDAGG